MSETPTPIEEQTNKTEKVLLRYTVPHPREGELTTGSVITDFTGQQIGDRVFAPGHGVVFITAMSKVPTEPLQCLCVTYASSDIRRRLLGNGHHETCKHFVPNVGALELIKALVRGIECWAGDEDGVHPECWDAYCKASFLTTGKIPEKGKQ